METSGSWTLKYDISGNLTGLEGPMSVAVDSDGNIWVADFYAAKVFEFVKGSTGNVPPMNAIDIPGGNASGVAIGSDGSIYVAHFSEVLVYASDASGAATPARAITGLDDATGIALQRDGAVVVDQTDNAVDTFAANATGDAEPLHSFSGTATKLDSKLPASVAIDPWGEIYVADAGNNSVTEYAADASGQGAAAAPAARLIGSPGLAVATIAVDSSGKLYVASGGGSVDSIRIFNPLFTVSGVTSASGPLAGGQTVTIHGSTFVAPILGVTFDGVPATDVQLVSATTITAVVPAHSAGEVDVAVSQANSDQTGVVTATLTNGYRYGTALALTGVDPLPGIGVGIAFLALGAALRVARRRKTSPAR